MSIIGATLQALRSNRHMALVLAAATIATIPLGSARAEYPDRTITIVSCFPAGGGTDIAMRMINNELSEALGKSVIVENRGGAGGSLGTTFVARAPADGYTLLGCSNAFVVNPSLYANVSLRSVQRFYADHGDRGVAEPVRGAVAVQDEDHE